MPKDVRHLRARHAAVATRIAVASATGAVAAVADAAPDAAAAAVRGQEGELRGAYREQAEPLQHRKLEQQEVPKDVRHLRTLRAATPAASAAAASHPPAAPAVSLVACARLRGPARFNLVRGQAREAEHLVQQKQVCVQILLLHVWRLLSTKMNDHAVWRL